MLNPLVLPDGILHTAEENRFGAVRKHDIHTGIDFFAPEGTLIQSMFDGTIEAIGQFTGTNVGSPWWNDTNYVVVYTESVGYVLYGELLLRNPAPRIGDKVKAGDILGRVKKVLTKDKGKPMSMLHLELYRDFESPVEWLHGQAKPQGLLDPTFLFKNFCVKGLEEFSH